MTLGPCRHEHPEPVSLSTGERVAMVCADCLIRLPAEWSGDVQEIRTLDGTARYVPA